MLAVGYTKSARNRPISESDILYIDTWDGKIKTLSRKGNNRYLVSFTDYVFLILQLIYKEDMSILVILIK